MGDSSPPTMADYAWNAANRAQDDNKLLLDRIKKLADIVSQLVTKVQRLENLVDPPNPKQDQKPATTAQRKMKKQAKELAKKE